MAFGRNVRELEFVDSGRRVPPVNNRFSDAEVAPVKLWHDAVTQRRRASAAKLTAYGEASPERPIKPTRIELAVLTALAHVYGSSLVNSASYR